MEEAAEISSFKRLSKKYNKESAKTNI